MLEVSDSEFARLFLVLLSAIAQSVVYALIGYAKRRDSKERFNGEDVMVTVVIGVIAGCLSFYLNVTPEQAALLILAQSGLTSYIEDGTKAVWRRWIKPWIDAQAVKAATPA